ncbi:ninein isoform X4 [Rhinatrema bivittatum]|uniref:ninein isoform X4 n=1 Tax=Rhinatrema bivittatum TaxID=194408 RepID=UPI0011284BA6|nr:ninein isoform X4 [Rhinatrema bivittatum]
MDEAEQDQYEARLKELFHSFDLTGTGSLGQEELTDLCHMLQLEEVAPTLQQTLLQDNLSGRVHFDQFKEALILILSSTLSNDESFQEQDCSPEAQPKYIKDGKRYGRRSLPELQDSMEDFAEVTVIEAEDDARSSHIPSGNRDELWKTQDSEEYEAEGQLRFWNPDDLSTSQNLFSPSQDWLEEKLQLICEDLGITRDGHLNRKKLITICEQYCFQQLEGEMLEDAFQNAGEDDTMSLQEFFYEVFKNGKPLTPSASTPYRQLKRHLSMQSFDESGRRTTTPSTMMGTVGFCLFSFLDDGTGYSSVEKILDTWHEEGIENSPAILKALDFDLDGKINLTELTMALENEMLVTKNGILQAVLASFKTEIKHLLEQADQAAREKEKLRSDLEKNEKLKTLMASEIDDHHAAIEQENEYNLRKLDEEYRERTTALKTELGKEREQILHQASKQRSDLEQEIEKMKIEENYIRDRLALSLKENSRLESELLENTEKMADYETLATTLQRNLDNVLKEKFGDLDPSSAEFFLQEERLAQMKKEHEQQCRELQDRIDELQCELEECHVQGIRTFKGSLKSSLSEELDGRSGGFESDQGLGSEDCPVNMSIEAEMAMEQMKEQHFRELEELKQELHDKVSQYENQLEEIQAISEKEQEAVKQKCKENIQKTEAQIRGLKIQSLELQEEMTKLKEEQERMASRYDDERKELQLKFDKEQALLQEQLKEKEVLEVSLKEEKERFNREREELLQNDAQRTRVQEKMSELVRTLQEEKNELEQGLQDQITRLTERHAIENEELRRQLQEKHQCELQEERCEILKLTEEKNALRNGIAALREEGTTSDQKLRVLKGSREDIWQSLETVKKETQAGQKMVEKLKKQVSELKARNQQLDSENAELCQKNMKNQTDVQDLNRRLVGILRQKEKEAGRAVMEEWESERARLREELESCKAKSSTLLSSLETELSKVKVQRHLLEQENHCLKQELDERKQLTRHPELSGLQDEISSVISNHETLLKEKEALNEELNRCVDKAAKVGFLESVIASMKQEQTSWEQQSQMLKNQLMGSQEKIQSLDETLQNINLQMSRAKSDLRVSQQEKEALKQEVMTLHKHLQNAKDKNQVLQGAVHSSGFQNQQKKRYWDDLAQLMEQEQQLIKQENERLQREVQSTKADLTHSREKIRQLESSVLAFKHQKYQNQSSLVKATEQEKLSLKRECEYLQKELASASKKISRMTSLEQELETIRIENEGLRKKQVKLDEQLMEMLHSSSSVMPSQSQHSRELQQQACTMVPREQYLQLQQQLLQVERRSQHFQEELESRPLDTNMPQGGHEELLKKMEGRMLDVEQKLRIVKMLLQEKVNQLKEQVSKNSKADGMIKDLYVENAQLLKALEMTEQRQQTAEKKNYLLEEKIAGLSKIVRDLAPSSVTAITMHHLRS